MQLVILLVVHVHSRIYLSGIPYSTGILIMMVID